MTTEINHMIKHMLPMSRCHQMTGCYIFQTRPQMGNTQVEVELVFNNTESLDPIPADEVVADVLIQAVTNPNNTFNLTLDPDSIEVIRE